MTKLQPQMKTADVQLNFDGPYCELIFKMRLRAFELSDNLKLCVVAW